MGLFRIEYFSRVNCDELKIAVNTRLLLPHRMEGIARFIHETSRRMVKDHPEDEFHFLFDRPYDKRFIYADNVTGHVLRPPSRHPVLWYLWFEWSVYHFLKRNDIDVFYSGDMYLSLRSKQPCLYVSHDLNYLHFPEGLKKSHLMYLRQFFPKYHRRADRIITVSEYSKQDIISQYGVEENKIDVAYNDVPAGFYPRSEAEKQSIRDELTESKDFFIYVGSLHPRKNLEGLLKAFEIFKTRYASDHKLLIFGRRAFKTGPIFKVYSSMEFKNDVKFIGDENHKVQDVLPAAEALCYPSLFEGFGIPILEAFYSEVPVITSIISSMPEVAGNAALLVDPYDPEAIAEAMNRILAKDLRQDLITKANARKNKFSWERSASVIYDRIKDLSDLN